MAYEILRRSTESIYDIMMLFLYGVSSGAGRVGMWIWWCSFKVYNDPGRSLPGNDVLDPRIGQSIACRKHGMHAYMHR